MKAHTSALEHGTDEADSLYAAQHHVYAADPEGDNPRESSGSDSTRKVVSWNWLFCASTVATSFSSTR